MFGLRLPAKRFTLLLLEEEEDYVADFVATCAWPAAVPGNLQKVRSMPGSMRLCSKSIFFDPDDGRVPIVRSAIGPYNNIQQKQHTTAQLLLLQAMATPDASLVANRRPVRKISCIVAGYPSFQCNS